MLNKDAKDIDDRIESYEHELEEDYYIGTSELIKGLEIVREVNRILNYEEILADEIQMFEFSIQKHLGKRNESYLNMPRARAAGVEYGMKIVNAVAIKNRKQFVKNN